MAQYYRCLVCGFPDSGEKPERCPNCGNVGLITFDNDTNFLFRRVKWEAKQRKLPKKPEA